MRTAIFHQKYNLLQSDSVIKAGWLQIFNTIRAESDFNIPFGSYSNVQRVDGATTLLKNIIMWLLG